MAFEIARLPGKRILPAFRRGQHLPGRRQFLRCVKLPDIHQRPIDRVHMLNRIEHLGPNRFRKSFRFCFNPVDSIRKTLQRHKTQRWRTQALPAVKNVHLQQIAAIGD